jgi:nucleotide-binding universal stress UspA family protein
MKSIFFSRVVWAIDVLESPEIQKHALFVLGALSRPTDAQIEPVYVLSAPYADPGSETKTDFEDAYQALAEKRMAELSSQSTLDNLAPGKVLFNRDGSVRSSVRVLVDHAIATDADALVVATHGRTGLPRFFMGSFAETLIVTSTVPVIVINPATKVRERISKILIPTTFRPRYRQAFERVVALAKTLDAQVTLLYKEPTIPGYAASPEFYRVLDKEAVERATIANEWKEWAIHYGVRADVKLDNEPGNIAGAVENYASDHNFDLIAMATQADPFSAVLLGSLSRRVVRQAPCPVWVMRVSAE